MIPKSKMGKNGPIKWLFASSGIIVEIFELNNVNNIIINNK